MRSPGSRRQYAWVTMREPPPDGTPIPRRSALGVCLRSVWRIVACRRCEVCDMRRATRLTAPCQAVCKECATCEFCALSEGWWNSLPAAELQRMRDDVAAWIEQREQSAGDSSTPTTTDYDGPDAALAGFLADAGRYPGLGDRLERSRSAEIAADYPDGIPPDGTSGSRST